VLVFHDVSESRELNRRLSYHASHDLLTGLVNRREFESRLERSLKSAKARETSYACALPRPRPVQDHQRFLRPQRRRRAAGQLSALLKPRSAGATRWRVSVATNSACCSRAAVAEEALRTAEVLKAIREHKFNWDDRTFRLGAASASCRSPATMRTWRRCSPPADSACQAAKEAGRNRIFSFQENDMDLMRRRREMQWAARINNALEESRFELFRMTIQPLQGGDGLHYEILLRMRDEPASWCRRDLFIPPPSATASRRRSTAGSSSTRSAGWCRRPTSASAWRCAPSTCPARAWPTTSSCPS
jgi:GGDEF domain-containing protein